MKYLLSIAVTVLLVTVLLVSGAPAVIPPAGAQTDEPLAHVDVAKVTPNLVAGAGPSELTVSGELTNTSGSVLNNVRARVERGAPAATEADARGALRGETSSETTSAFVPLSGSLAPGQKIPFEVRVPLTGVGGSLRVDRPGVYPLSINVNGKPASSSRTEVGTAQFLLPVLAPPGGQHAPPPRPTPMTMLVPIMDYGRLERNIPGQSPVLIDDQLSTSLAPGGRLFELVQAVADNAAQGSPVGNGLCFAIDPDLIATVKAMQGGYLVRQPDGGLRPGIGAGTAQLWLRQLGMATKGRCVVALPYGDADVVALGRAGLPDLVKGAMDGAKLIHETLKVEPRRDVFWPIDGALDEPTASQLRDLGVRTFLMQPSAVTAPSGSLRPARLKTERSSANTPAPTVQPIDPLLSSAVNPLWDSTGKTTEAAPRSNGALTTQNTLGALTFRATANHAVGATSVLAPPRRWNLQGPELRDLLEGMEQLAKARYIAPTTLPSASSDGKSSTAQTSVNSPSPKLPEVSLNYPMLAAGNEIHRRVLDDLAAANFKVGDLAQSTEGEPASNVEPFELTNPLRDGLLRAASSAWRGNPGGSQFWLDTGKRTVESVFSRVQISEVDRRVTLTASNSPIPLTVRNDLPVIVWLSLHITGPRGVKVTDLGFPLKIPAHGSRTFMLQTEFSRAGKFNIDVTARTKLGTTLGETQRLRLESNAYGAVTLILTISAASLLVLLSGRRILRRLRNRRNARPAAGSTGSSPASGSALTTSPNAVTDEIPPITESTTESDRNTS